MPRPLYRLRVEPPEGPAYDYALTGESVVVGRAATAGLAPPDPFLSRTHARLYWDGDALCVEDLGSRNGTSLNGRLLTAPAVLAAGDVLALSETTLTVHEVGAATIQEGDPGTLFFRAAELLPEPAAGGRSLAMSQASLGPYVERLEILNEIHEALGKLVSPEELLNLILKRAFDHLRPEQGVIFLRQDDGRYARVASRSLPGSTSPMPDSRSLLAEVAGKGLAALVLDIATDARLAGTQSLRGFRSLVAAPLLDGEGSIGMIVLTSKAESRRFTEEDLRLLVSLSSIAALKIRNSSLAEEAGRQRRDLELARRIQQALLPDHTPAVPGYEIYGENLPSQGISGDYYQVLLRQGGECVLIVVDVSGKGIAASLLTASLEALSAGPIEDGLPPGEIFTKLSQLLHRRTPPEKYATAFLGILDPESGTFRYANAGHPPGLLLSRGGEVRELASTGPPIGLVAGATVRTAEAALSPGDTVVLYTDGLSEAADPDSDELGVERLADICRRHIAESPDASLDDLAKSIGYELVLFARGTPFADDRTLVLLRRKA
ncbi:MAG TPA: SpoIIE family protein phosphatase [Thermoanaerobaculia bacterium]